MKNLMECIIPVMVAFAVLSTPRHCLPSPEHEYGGAGLSPATASSSRMARGRPRITPRRSQNSVRCDSTTELDSGESNLPPRHGKPRPGEPYALIRSVKNTTYHMTNVGEEFLPAGTRYKGLTTENGWPAAEIWHRREIDAAPVGFPNREDHERLPLGLDRGSDQSPRIYRRR
jgi:hypothetical protein